ncbi:MAG TPA: hypothetical protein VNW92_18805 [Polyangiaceae bacterium]|jgi:hypothetical protein|nr:hypothetical protein [Polyangiaceae bacterium]
MRLPSLFAPCALLISGVSLLGLISCGSSDAASGASGGGSAGASGSAGGSSGAGGESGAPGSVGAGSAPKAGYIGVVSQATATATVFNNFVSAGFNDGPGSTFPKGCERQVVGKCGVVLCDFTNGGDQLPAPGAAVSAGTITIGGTAPTFSVAYDAGTQLYGTTPAVPKDRLLFAGGETITFAAAGADVPAFSASLVAPAPLTVTSPALPSGGFSLDTSKDLVFEWTGTSTGLLTFNVRTVTVNGATAVASTFVSCQFETSALTGTIPTALLQKLQKTDASTTGALSTDLSNTKEVPAGDFMVHLAVGSLATQADGKLPYTAAQVTIL